MLAAVSDYCSLAIIAAASGMREDSQKAMMIIHVGGPNAGSRFTPSTIANRMR